MCMELPSYYSLPIWQAKHSFTSCSKWVIFFIMLLWNTWLTNRLFQHTCTCKHTCIPTVGTPPQRHDQSIHHHTPSPIVQTDRAPPGLPLGSLLPQVSLAHLKNTIDHTDSSCWQKCIPVLWSYPKPQSQEILKDIYTHIPSQTWSSGQTCLVNRACALMLPAKEVAWTPVSFHARNHLCVQKGKLWDSIASLVFTHSLSCSFSLPNCIHSHC